MTKMRNSFVALDASAIGAALAECRQRAGMTQQQAADAMGVSCSVWGDLERGRREPLPSTIRRAFAAVGADAELAIRAARRKK